MAAFVRHISYYVSSKIRNITFLLAGIFFFNLNADAQYFGRNKPGYRSFKFDVLQTPNFEIYHYLNNDSLLKTISHWSENWYLNHLKIFKDTFKVKNPVIFYNNHPDFQQTNTISSLIGTGTGGVTESLKNRVIMPVAPSLAQTDHTLGHELVHAFQYNMFLRSDTSKRMSINNIPLWMIEGMAEYLSIGSIDPNTAMWMRDALLNNRFPTIRKLSDQSEYFPYRYGQAFWAMAGKTWGDTIIRPFLEKTGQYGFDKAVNMMFGLNEPTLSGMWKSATQVWFRQYLKDSIDNLAGKVIVSDKNGGRINISPMISPDGKFIAFFSERDLFTLDLFLADVSNGKIIKRLASVVNSNSIDDFDFVESAGTWSPDGKKFAIVIFRKGVNKLALIDVERGRITRRLAIPGVASFSNPAWSPDGKKIVVSGLVEGVSDLYLYYLDSGRVERLTSDIASNLHPAWSSDGKYIVFSQEKVNTGASHRKYSFNLAILDIGSGAIRELDVFNGAYNLDPCFSDNNRSIYFLSDADGFRNLYEYDLESDRLYRLTEYMTGISGITPYSPAISVSLDGNIISYTYYFNNKYQIV
ncbi:MAG TPA: tolB protein precursor, partial [Bacteroidales bacterium]|nr:tolB protein precursor [Bacteroidales bacterium]